MYVFLILKCMNGCQSLGFRGVFRIFVVGTVNK